MYDIILHSPTIRKKKMTKATTIITNPGTKNDHDLQQLQQQFSRHFKFYLYSGTCLTKGGCYREVAC